MNKNLLIASNNTTDAKGIEDAFCKAEGIRVLPSVYTGRDAMDMIFARDVDILILDLFLHDLDGICVLDFIGKLGEDRRPLVFLTTAVADDRLLSIVKDRVLYCFTKPLKFETIQLRVLEFLGCASAKRKPPTRRWTFWRARLLPVSGQSACLRI